MLPQLVIQPASLDVPAAALRGSLDPTTGIFYTAPDRARVRTPLACDKCRVRKAKCTGDRPVCERCRNRGLACNYSTDERRRKVKDRDKHPPARLGVRSNSMSEVVFVSAEPTQEHPTQNALALSFDQVVSPDPAIDSFFIDPRPASLAEHGLLSGLAGQDLAECMYPIYPGFDNVTSAESPGRTPSTSTSASASPILTRAHPDGFPTTPINSYPNSPFTLASLSPSPLGHVDFASAYPLFSNEMAWCDVKDGSHALGGNVYLDVDGMF